MSGGACHERAAGLRRAFLFIVFLHAIHVPLSQAQAQAQRAGIDDDIAILLAGHPGESGVSPLHSGRKAFIARMDLVERAQRGIDVQSYIWRSDNTGQALLERLLGAADRGVPVRLLLDDINIDVDDPLLGSLDAHELIEIRIFNPVIKRRWRWLDALTEWPRINRRMHNKALIADGAAAIIGGRNVGDEYYDAGFDFDFFDFDALTVGPVAHEIAKSFEQFWNHELAVPISNLAAKGGKIPSLDETRTALRAHMQSFGATRYAQGLEDHAALSPRNAWYWGEAHVYYDLPHKVDPQAHDGVARVAAPLYEAFDSGQREIIIISPYVIPKRSGVERFERLRGRGIDITLVTNSLASTDVVLTHVGYAKRRKDMLRAGIQIYEIKPQRQRRIRRGEAGLGSSSRASLHTKIFIVDRRRILLGSANYDPRSLRLNTELMLSIDSPTLGEALQKWLDGVIEHHAYRVDLVNRSDAGGGRMEWITHENGREVRLFVDPETSWWRRAALWLLSLLPIENQL